MNALRTVSLLAATISMGLVAGVFALYAHTIMPGLAKTDDRTFVGAFQAIDRAIINPWFLAGGFVGALMFTWITWNWSSTAVRPSARPSTVRDNLRMRSWGDASGARQLRRDVAGSRR
jgi:hypothetical protein